MNPNISEREGKDSQSESVAPTVAASATSSTSDMVAATDHGQSRGAPAPVDISVKWPQMKMSVAELSPPVPVVQTIAALDEDMFGEDAPGKKKKPTATVKLDLIEDDDTPLPIEALAASINKEDEGRDIKEKGKKGPERIEGGDDDVDCVPSLQGRDEDDLNKKPAAAKRPVTQPQPQPSRPHHAAMTVPPNQDGGNNQDLQPQSQAQAPTMPHPQSSDIQPPSFPKLHEVEAILVVEEPPAPVYDATIVPANQDIESQEEEVPWWKRKTYGIGLLLCVSVLVLGTVVGTQGRNDKGTVDNEFQNGIQGEGADPPKSPINLFNLTSPKLLPNDGQAGDQFGISVAVSGNTAVVGARSDDQNGSASGSAYVYIWNGNTWEQQAKLLPNDGYADDTFGVAVSVSGDTVVVGAQYDDDSGFNSGSAYVFIRNGDKWEQQAKLLPNGGQACDTFGWSVSVSGNTAVVSARWDDDNGGNSGSAYVFIRNGDKWEQQAKLLPNDAQPSDNFGYAVSVSGDTVVAGAWGDDDNGSDSGSAYVFIRNGDKWEQQAKLLPNDGQAHNWFGTAVSMSGDTVVVGAYSDSDNDSNSDSAYVFIRNGDKWEQQAKLLPNDGHADDRFGYAVAVSGNIAVVGADYDDDNGGNSGSAYVFIRNGNTWEQQDKLLPIDGQSGDTFGVAVSVSGDTVVAGAWGDDDNGNDSGSAYIFSL